MSDRDSNAHKFFDRNPIQPIEEGRRSTDTGDPSIFRVLAGEYHTREAELDRISRELNRQREEPFVNDVRIALQNFETYVSVLTGSMMDCDPFVRLSAILMWTGMQAEKASGKERIEKKVLFDDKNGYHMALPDNMSMTSLELNPTRPRFPAPRATPLYQPIARQQGACCSCGCSCSCSPNVERESTIKRWKKLLGFSGATSD